jgi:hypothetical protein
MPDKSFMTGANSTNNATASQTPSQPAVSQPAVKNVAPSNKPLPPGGRLNNSETQTAYANNAGSKEKIDIKFLPNILDNYDVYTYHWKFFIVPLQKSSSGEVLNTDYQTIIAESGVSDLTIDKVELQGITTPSVECGTGTMTHLKFEIVEPSGAGLLDKMFYESISLGIGNWMVTPYFLQLEFKSRNPITESVEINGTSGGLSSMKWVWPIKLTSSKVNVTHVGTRYEFDAIMYDELAQSNSYFAVQHNVSLAKLTTFGDAMKDLENKLNEDCYEKLIDNYSIPDTYRIVVDPILAKTPLVNPDSNKNTARSSDYVDFSKKSATFSTGTSIDKIVDSLLGSTSLGQQKAQDSSTPSSTPKPIQAETKSMKKLWRVVTETKPIAFDALRQDNAVAITIYVVEYAIGVLDANPSQTGQTPDTISASKKRLDEYMNNRILRKKYNYIFTGLNDQVIALDLNMNYAFAAATARFGGIYIDGAAGSSKGASQQENQENEKKAGEIIRKTLQYINSAEPGTNLDSKIADAKKSISNTKVSKEVADRYSVLLEKAKPANKTAFIKELQTGGGLSSNGRVGAYDEKGNLLPTVQAASLASSNNGLTFISDVNANSPEAKKIREIADSTRKGKLRPVPYREASQEGNFTGIDPASDAGRARTSSMFATALYSSLDGSMQSMKLTIKGDPFWLFPRSTGSNQTSLNYKSNMADSVAIAEIKNAHTTYGESVNVLGTDNFIIIRFRTPRIYNDTTGSLDPFTEVDTFSGVYKVIRIVSKFDTGKFTQDIECILDPVVDLSQLSDFIKFIDRIEVANSQPDPELYSVAQTMPTTSVKANKLIGTDTPNGQDPTPGVTPILNLKQTYGNIQDNNLTSNIPAVPSTEKIAFENAKKG